MSKSNTYVKKIVRTAIILAVILVIQCFKNFSVWISGPLVNAILIIATLSIGLWGGAALAIISPISSYIITGAPIIAMTKFTLFPVIMLGNLALVLGVWAFMNKGKFACSIGMAVGSILKWLIMWGAVSLFIMPMFAELAASKPPIAYALGWTFSHSQLITALIGSVIAYAAWIPLRRFLHQ